MSSRYKFDRLEFAGSLGDLGTLLPIAIGFSIGLFYILTGIYYGVTVPVQPMKVIGAYAIATGMGVSQILASGALMGILLLIIGGTGAITVMGKYIPKPVVRGVQLSTGVLLMAQGVKFILGTSTFQLLKGAVEPYLIFQGLGPLPVGIVIGVIGGLLTLLLLENNKLPAGLFVVLGGMVVGLVFGTHEGFDKLRIHMNMPKILPFGFPSWSDASMGFLILVLPQIPMTLGNAVIAYADLSEEYFGVASKKLTYKSVCISMALGNFVSFLVGGMPLCHGAGGLAAHYRFGARTAGSNLMIGVIFLALAILLGMNALSVLYLIPMSILGVLLLFAGSQLALTLIDVREKKELFVVLVMLGLTLASNLAVGFLVGIAMAYALKSDRLTV
jgi:SulP family sulfate permease